MADKPSVQLQERVNALLRSNVDEVGKLARILCEGSNSQQVLLKSARKMASAESSLEHTLQSLKQLETVTSDLHAQADKVAQSIEKTHSVVQQFQQHFRD